MRVLTFVLATFLVLVCATRPPARLSSVQDADATAESLRPKDGKGDGGSDDDDEDYRIAGGYEQSTARRPG